MSTEINTRSSIADDLANELLNTSIDLSIDYSEIFIDGFVNNDALKEIPIVKTLVGIAKTGISINHLFFTKKVITFIKEFNSNTIDPENLQKFRHKVNSDTKYRNKVVEQIMIYNDRFLDLKQSQISAQLFRSYVNGFITYEEFNYLNIFLEKLHPKAYLFMRDLEQYNFKIIDDSANIPREWELEALITATGLGTEPGDFWHGFKLTNDGINLYKYGIKPTSTNP